MRSVIELQNSSTRGEFFRLAQKMAQRFISDDAEEEINVPAATKRNILAKMRTANQDTIDPFIFSEAWEHVTSLLQTSNYPRFVSTFVKENPLRDDP